MNISFPYDVSHNGRTSLADDDKHIVDLIEQVLFTMPGERVNRPGFGSGLMQLVFQPNSDELVATVQFLVQGALQQYLGELIEVNGVDVKNIDSSLLVNIDFTVRSTQERKQAGFKKMVP